MTGIYMKNDIGWYPIHSAPENIPVLTRIKDSLHGERNVQTLIRRGQLWWASDNTYVYYQPTHWRPVYDES